MSTRSSNLPFSVLFPNVALVKNIYARLRLHSRNTQTMKQLVKNFYLCVCSSTGHGFSELQEKDTCTCSAPTWPVDIDMLFSNRSYMCTRLRRNGFQAEPVENRVQKLESQHCCTPHSFVPSCCSCRCVRKSRGAARVPGGHRRG